MKFFFFFIVIVSASFVSLRLSAQSAADTTGSKQSVKHLYIDVHHLGAGKVNYQAVAEAHAKDLAVQKKYGVQFIEYWVDEARGTVYCLSSSADTNSIRKTHAEAHGLLPDQFFLMTDGPEAAINTNKNYFLDVHELGAGHVTAKDVAGAHQKDLAVQGKYGVNFINYWVNEQNGVVMCLSQANDSAAVINTHKEAHGLIPSHITKVKPGK